MDQRRLTEWLALPETQWFLAGYRNLVDPSSQWARADSHPELCRLQGRAFALEMLSSLLEPDD